MIFLFSKYLQHFGESPLPAYEPAFDWENERSMIFGQRVPESHPTQYGRSILVAQYTFVYILCVFIFLTMLILGTLFVACF